MLSEEDFTRRYTEQMCKHFGKKVEKWIMDLQEYLKEKGGE